MLLSLEDFHELADFHELTGETTFGGHTQSELTFNGSAGCKKRAYVALSQQNDIQVQSRLGSYLRPTTTVRDLATIEPPFLGELVSNLNSQNVEIDAFFRFQTQQLQSGIELLRRKQSGELLSMVEKQTAKRLRVKEMELEYISKRSMELEEQVRQMAAESQVLFNYAKTSEAMVSRLREKLTEVLTDQIACPAIDAGEGYGDSAEEASATENQIQRACSVCGEREVCVLLLPCRHLCVCKECESRIETFPVCNSCMNARIQVVVP